MEDIKYDSPAPESLQNLDILDLERRAVVFVEEMAQCPSSRVMISTEADAVRAVAMVKDLLDNFMRHNEKGPLDMPKRSPHPLPVTAWPDLKYVINPDYHRLILSLCAFRTEMTYSDSHIMPSGFSSPDATRMAGILGTMAENADHLTKDPGVDVPNVLSHADVINPAPR